MNRNWLLLALGTAACSSNAANTDNDSGNERGSARQQLETNDAASTPMPAQSPKRVVGYFAGWGVYGRDFHVMDYPAAQTTHLNYAFAKIANGECALVDPYADIDKFYPGDSWDAGALRGSFNQLRKLKEQYPHLKTLISVGGWTLSGEFSDVALTEASRKKFATSCVSLFVDQYDFDGID